MSWVDDLCEAPLPILAMDPQVTADFLARLLNLSSHSTILQVLGSPGHQGVQVKV